jgi:tRNA pseudouridine38-40 synthase
VQHVRGKLKPQFNQCLRVVVEYDGSKYSGWAEQRNARTVMGELRTALETVLKSEIELVGAGRTDAGVHARGQVAHVKYSAAKPAVEPFVLTQANMKLPAEIAIRKLHKAPLAFHARHDATEREYVYQIATRKTAFEKKYVWWIKEPLNIAAMQAGAALIVGRHDFKCFQAQDPGRPNESSIVVVNQAKIEVLEDRLLFRIAASHFVWRMVRRLTGVLVKLGLEEISLEDIELLLSAKEDPRLDVAAWTAPSSGLFFERVSYS